MFIYFVLSLLPSWCRRSEAHETLTKGLMLLLRVGFTVQVPVLEAIPWLHKHRFNAVSRYRTCDPKVVKCDTHAFSEPTFQAALYDSICAYKSHFSVHHEGMRLTLELRSLGRTILF